MSDDEIIAALKSGDTLNFGCHGRNSDVMSLISRLERDGLVRTWDISGSQETRRAVKWIEKGPDHG